MAALRLFGKIVKWTLIGLGSLLALLVVASALVVALGITISAAPWRERIAAEASQALGRPVRLEGPLELVPTLRPVAQGRRPAHRQSPRLLAAGVRQPW